MTRIQLELRRFRLTAWVAVALHLGIAAASIAQIIPLDSEFQVSQSTTVCAVNPKIVPRSDGGFVVVWGDSSAQSIRWRAFDANSNPLNSETSLQNAATNLTFADVATDPSDDLVVVWSVDNEGSEELRGRRYASDGTAVGADFAVGGGAVPRVADANLATNDLGEFVVAWTEDPYGSSSVEARRFASDGTAMGAQFTVSGSNNAKRPAVARDVDSSEFVIAWQEDVGGSSDIFLQRYLANGDLLGSEMVINSYTTGSQTGPAVAMAATGEILVSWSGPSSTSGGFDRASLAFLTSTGASEGEVEIGGITTQQANTSLATSLDSRSFTVGMDDLNLGVPEGPIGFNVRAAFNYAFDQGVASVETGPQSSTAVAVDEADRVTIVWETDTDDDLCSTVSAARGQLYQNLGLVTLLGKLYGRSPQSAWHYYLFSPPAPGDYEVEVWNMTGDIDLYTRIGALPNLADFDCRPFEGGIAPETCTFRLETTPVVIGVNAFNTGSLEFLLQIRSVPPLFVDGFESGSTLAWSATVTP